MNRDDWMANAFFLLKWMNIIDQIALHVYDPTTEETDPAMNAISKILDVTMMVIPKATVYHRK